MASRGTPNPDGKWVIRRKGQYNDYWSAARGWSAYDEADLFSETSRAICMLPLEGYWSQTHRKQDEKEQLW